MNRRRTTVIIAIFIIVLVLALMFLLLMCVVMSHGDQFNTRRTHVNYSSRHTIVPTTTRPTSDGTVVPTLVVPAITDPCVQMTIKPTETLPTSPPLTTPPLPIPASVIANLTLGGEETLVFASNRTAFNCNIKNPPLLIDYTLTVPNVTRTRVVTDPVSGSDKVETISYPDPIAFFEVTVKDLGTERVVAQDGYGGRYNVANSKKVWVRYPGRYYIEFSGNRVTADIRFRIPGEG